MSNLKDMNPDHSQDLNEENSGDELKKKNKKGGSFNTVAAAAMTMALIAFFARDKIKSILQPEDETRYEIIVPPQDEAPIDPNRPGFLDQERIKLFGLDQLMAYKDHYDNYIFNAITGNRAFVQTFFIYKSAKEPYPFPYHAFIFKAVDPKSNTTLPARLGKSKGGQKLTDLFNNVTIYKGNNPKDIQAIKTILTTSYKVSFNITLDPDAIEISFDEKGKITGIRYNAPNAAEIVVTTQVAVERKKGDDFSELKSISKTESVQYHIVDKDGDLQFPPSIMIDIGVAIPPSALPKYNEIKYEKTFQSQGKKITVPIHIRFDSLEEERDQLIHKKRPYTLKAPDGEVWNNHARFILENDPYIQGIAELIANNFQTKKQKMQAIVDFIHSYRYVPDEYGNAEKTPKMYFISKGGDCEDSSIITAALARAVGIDCVFLHFKDHAAIACDIDGSGSAFEFEGKKYEWVETTPHGGKIGERPYKAGELMGISTFEGDTVVHVEEAKKKIVESKKKKLAVRNNSQSGRGYFYR